MAKKRPAALAHTEPDFGRECLRSMGFFGKPLCPWEPGDPIVGDGQGRLRIAVNGERYAGIVLDQSIARPMDTAHVADLVAEPQFPDVGRMGLWARVPHGTPTTGDWNADLAMNTSRVLDRLQQRFQADARHEQTAFISTSIEDAHITRKSDTERVGSHIVLGRIPYGGQLIQSAKGWVYSSHFPRTNSEPDPAFPWKYAGHLSLVGQILCISAVLADRMAWLTASPPDGAQVDALRAIGGRVKSPLDWNDADRRDMELARAELLQWKKPQADRRVKQSSAFTPEAGKPVLVASAAAIIGTRSDGLLKKLHARRYPVHGVKGRYMAGIEHIIIAVGGKGGKALRVWAEREQG